MLETAKKERLRRLPAVDAVLRSPGVDWLAEQYGWPAVTAAVRKVVGVARQEILADGSPETGEEILVATAANVLSQRGLRNVVNATGVILHTNLGRSILSDQAVEAVTDAARGYTNLEYELSTGNRGSRYDHSVPLLREITGAEDALVVNNCASATLLALSVIISEAGDMVGNPEVIISRGQLIEIGGGFRIPEVLELSGAKLREVGTTNRTRLADYENAIGEHTRAILWVHPSNFETQGFTESVSVKNLSTLDPPVIADVGSGALVPMDDEPLVQQNVRAGAELTIFSGDKLLGGPQAGIIVGSSRWISAMRRHPLTRAIRADKLCLAALGETLNSYQKGTALEDLPTLKMFHAPAEEVRKRAEKLAAALTESREDLEVDVAPSVARSGGGTLPIYEIPSFAVRLGGQDADALVESLRAADPPVIGRVADGKLWLDARTLLPGDEEAILEAMRATE
ncbi:L-seryl-tRNA(Sec) selenium transferase [soil metagenome]